MDEKQEQKFHQLTEEPVGRLISQLAVPCIISMLVTAFYNMADTFFVGMLRSNAATGAVGVVFSMMAVIQAIGFFFGHGSGNFISRELGKHHMEEASNMAATGFFTALFEPLINHKRVSMKEIAFSLIAVGGIALIFHFDVRYRVGVLMGIVSSALASLFTITNKRVSVNYSSGTMLLYEMIGGFVGLTCLFPLYDYAFGVDFVLPGQTDFCYLLCLASVCTVCLYILQIQVLKVISAFTVNLSYNLEPIYSIILAMILFDEGRYLDQSFYMGLFLILFSVVSQSMYAFLRRRSAGPA